MLLTDDYPHQPPQRAWLRWRENWLYFLVDPQNDAFVTAHVSLQPTFGIARYSCNLILDGERFSFAEEVPLPDKTVLSNCVDLGPFKMQFLQPLKSFQITFDGPSHFVDMRLDATLPMFDYNACSELNPDDYSLSETTAKGFGVFRHQNQTMRGAGTIRSKKDGKERNISGTGYRDHSWGMRDDNLTLEHTWAWMSFPGSTVHITMVNTQHRPELWSREGYLGTPEGNVALKSCGTTLKGESVDRLPAEVEFHFVDAFNRSDVITADIAGAYARNRFMSSRPGALGYVMRHSFCRCIRKSDGAEGIALVEIGWAETPEDSVLSSGQTDRK